VSGAKTSSGLLLSETFFTEAPTTLYRLYGEKRHLLYVGITGGLKVRLAQHAAEKDWWPEVRERSLALYPTRVLAESAETAAIKAERPVHNVAHAMRDDDPVFINRGAVLDLVINDSLTGRAISTGVLRLCGWEDAEIRAELKMAQGTWCRVVALLREHERIVGWRCQHDDVISSEEAATMACGCAFPDLRPVMAPAA
jgi:predicted GIY-YIG superfamily endonuclease